jgi:hypothetical protein
MPLQMGWAEAYAHPQTCSTAAREGATIVRAPASYRSGESMPARARYVYVTTAWWSAPASAASTSECIPHSIASARGAITGVHRGRQTHNTSSLLPSTTRRPVELSECKRAVNVSREITGTVAERAARDGIHQSRILKCSGSGPAHANMHRDTRAVRYRRKLRCNTTREREAAAEPAGREQPVRRTSCDRWERAAELNNQHQATGCNHPVGCSRLTDLAATATRRTPQLQSAGAHAPRVNPAAFGGR